MYGINIYVLLSTVRYVRLIIIILEILLKKMDENVPLTEPGCSLCKAPQHQFHYQYFLSLPGCEYFQIYLWILKDWSWNQYTLMSTSIIFGLLALIWILCMVSFALAQRIYSEAFIGTAAFLWLFANFVWMCGDFWQLDGRENGDQVYDTCYQISRGLMTTSVVMLVTFLFIFLPCRTFKSDKQQPILMKLAATSPPVPQIVGSSIFEEFREWEIIHLLLWALKDTFWVWDLFIPYMIAFLCTMTFAIDLIWRFSTYTNQYLETVHSIVIFLWVLANGIWALGELDTERDLSLQDRQNYSFFQPLNTNKLLPRRISGWVFLLTSIYILVFFIQWTIVSWRGKVPTYQEHQQKIKTVVTTKVYGSYDCEKIDIQITNIT